MKVSKEKHTGIKRAFVYILLGTMLVNGSSKVQTDKNYVVAFLPNEKRDYESSSGMRMEGLTNVLERMQ